MWAEEEITSKTTYEICLLVTGKPYLQHLETKMDKSCPWDFFFKAPEDRTLLWKAAAGPWQLLLFKELETKATCKCLFGLGKHWFASLCQRSGFSWGQGKDFQGSIHVQCKKQSKICSWNRKLGIFLISLSFRNFSHKNLLASRDKLWTPVSGTPHVKASPWKGSCLNKTS